MSAESYFEAHSAKVYHFVNKALTSDSLSSKSGPEARAIRCHVKRVLDGQRKRRQRHNSTSSRLASTADIAQYGLPFKHSRPIGPLDYEKYVARSAASLREDSTRPYLSPNNTTISSGFTAHEQLPAIPMRIDDPEKLQLVRNSRSASSSKLDADACTQSHPWPPAEPLAPPRSAAFETFGILPIDLTSHELGMIRCYILQSTDLPNDVYHSGRAFNKMPRSTLEEHVRGCLGSEIALASFMVFLTSMWDKRRGTRWSQLSCRWKKHALQSFQKALCTESSLNSDHLQAMVSLIAAEGVQCNVAGVHVHLQAAKQALSATNAQAPISSFSRYLFHTYDTRRACENASPPILLPLVQPGFVKSKPKGSFHAAFDTVNRCDTGFLALRVELLDHPLLSIIEEMLEHFMVHQNYLQYPGSDFHISLWIMNRRTALRYRLLELPAYTPLLHSVRTTLLIWTFIYQIDTHSDSTLCSLVADLFFVLSTWRRESKRLRDLEIWMLITGAIAEASSDKVEWFSHEVRTMLPLSYELDGYLASMKDIMRRFLFLDGVRDAALRRLAKRMIAKNLKVIPIENDIQCQ